MIYVARNQRADRPARSTRRGREWRNGEEGPGQLRSPPPAPARDAQSAGSSRAERHRSCTFVQGSGRRCPTDVGRCHDVRDAPARCRTSSRQSARWRRRAQALAGAADVPTVRCGVQGYESLSWSGIAVPAGTRGPYRETHKDLNAVDRDAEMRQKLEEAGAETVGGPPSLRPISARAREWTRSAGQTKLRIEGSSLRHGPARSYFRLSPGGAARARAARRGQNTSAGAGRAGLQHAIRLEAAYSDMHAGRRQYTRGRHAGAEGAIVPVPPRERPECQRESPPRGRQAVLFNALMGNSTPGRGADPAASWWRTPTSRLCRRVPVWIHTAPRRRQAAPRRA